MKRVMVFIDNSNVFKHLCSLCGGVGGSSWCKQYDPLFLAQKLAGERELVKVMFYCAPPPQSLFLRDPVKYSSQSSYYDAIKKLDKVEVKFATLTTNGSVLFEKNLDTQLTADMIKLAATNAYDQAIIVSNDGDFVSAVDSAKSLGKKVEVAHFKSKFSMDLRQAADITRRLRPSFFQVINYS